MPPKVFVLGATGYIGGDFLYVVTKAHPEWEVTCLVRNSTKGSKIAAQYPKIRLVYGDLDSTDVIEEETAKADIIYTAADCDHIPSAHAIVTALHRKTTPSFLIHTSGTGILTYETTDQKAWGKALPKVYNDFDGLTEITQSIPDHAPHRPVDKLILSAGAEGSNPNGLIHTAIVAPPTIYDVGRGPDNVDSSQVPKVARTFLKRGEGFTVRGSQNIWCQVNIQDLSQLYLNLAECAADALAKNPVGNGEPATWNQQGYYLCESGTFVWSDVIEGIAKYAHEKLGLVKSSAVRSLEPEEIRKIEPGFIGWCGGNSIGDAIRARRLLGWAPKVSEKTTLVDTLGELVEREAKKLGLVKGHGQVVAEEVKF